MEWIEFNQKMKEMSPDYMDHRRDARKQMYKTYLKEQEVHTISIPTVGCSYTYTVNAVNEMLKDCLAPLPKAVPCSPKHDMFPEDMYYKQEGITPMNYASASVTTAPTEAQTQRKYLEQRLYDVYQGKREPLEAKFGLTDDAPPTTPSELAERLKAGKFAIRGLDDGSDKNDYRYWSASELIRWRDPAKKADQAGFDAAKADLKAKRQAALDTIKIDEPKAGLDAVKALESWEPTGAAN